MKKNSGPIKYFIVAGAIVALGASIYVVMTPGLAFSTNQSTDDAHVATDYTVVAPKVSGFISKVLVSDNQRVHAGQLLAQIDDRDYQTAVIGAQANVFVAKGSLEQAAANLERQNAVIKQAQAMIRVAEADVDFSRKNLRRYSGLAKEGAGSLQNAQQARLKIDTAEAKLDFDRAALTSTQRQVTVLEANRDKAAGELQRANAELEKAQLNLSYTHITAPIDGVIGHRSLRLGSFVNPGSPLLAIVPVRQAYIIGNFLETQLANVHAGQLVDITIDAYPGISLRGHVDSIAPATGGEFSPIKPSNATGNFTKIVQRIPVKIDINDGQKLAEQLRSGMSVVATIETNSQSSYTGDTRKETSK